MSMPTTVVDGHTLAALTASSPTPVPTSRKLVTSARSGWAALMSGGTIIEPRPQPSRMTGSVNVQPVTRPGASMSSFA